MVDNPGQVVTDSEKKVMKKKNKCVTKKKERLVKFYTFVKSLLFFYLWSPAVLLSCCIAALVSCPESLAISLSYCMPTAVFCSRSLIILLFYCVPAPIFYFGSLVILLSYCKPALAAFVAFFLPCYTFVSYCGREFQLFCCYFLCLVYLFFLDFVLSKYLNNPC